MAFSGRSKWRFLVSLYLAGACIARDPSFRPARQPFFFSQFGTSLKYIILKIPFFCGCRMEDRTMRSDPSFRGPGFFSEIMFLPF